MSDEPFNNIKSQIIGSEIGGEVTLGEIDPSLAMIDDIKWRFGMQDDGLFWDSKDNRECTFSDVIDIIAPMLIEHGANTLARSTERQPSKYPPSKA